MLTDEELLPGLTVEFGRADLKIERPIVESPLPFEARGYLVADRRRALLYVAGVARFAVRDGRHVTIEPLTRLSADVDLWLQGTVRALAFAQRGVFALHASTVDIDGTTVAICGPQRIGKSTVALRLMQRGHALIADDIAPLVPVGDVIVHRPVSRSPRIDAETAEALGLDVRGAIHSPGLRKFILPRSTGSPGPVGIVLALRTAGEEVGSRSLGPAPAVAVIQADAYRVRLLRDVWASDLFDWAATIVSRVPVVLVTRPAAGWTVDEVTRLIEQAAADIHNPAR